MVGFAVSFIFQEIHKNLVSGGLPVILTGFCYDLCILLIFYTV